MGGRSMGVSFDGWAGWPTEQTGVASTTRWALICLETVGGELLKKRFLLVWNCPMLLRSLFVMQSGQDDDFSSGNCCLGEEFISLFRAAIQIRCAFLCTESAY